MKKIILLLILIGVFSIAGSYAMAPVSVNKRTTAAFRAEFKKAKDVQWTSYSDYVRAQFSLNKQIMFAYYKPTGELICVIRNILTTDLPAYLRNDLKKDYHSYWVTELIEVHTDQGAAYYIKLENADNVVTLSSDNNNDWSVYNQSPKEATSLVTVNF